MKSASVIAPGQFFYRPLSVFVQVILLRPWLIGAVAVLAATALLFLARLGDRAVVSEEVRWAEVAREMLATGDYLHPTINGQTYYDKPVGSYWLIIAASTLTGSVDETAARLPAAVAGWFGVWLVMLLGRRLYDDPTAILSGVVLATSFGFVFYARRATADVETVTGVLAAITLYTRNRESASSRWVGGLWLVMTVTSLTKGLLGFALPAIVLAAHGTEIGLADVPLGESRLDAIVRGNRWLFNGWTPFAVLLGLAVYLLPFLLSTWHTGALDGLAMVWRENILRFVSPHNHAGPVYLYAGVIFLLACPWSAFLPAALIPPPAGQASTGDRFARIYFWAVFLFFTASASRRSYYLLPVLPPTALLLARLLVVQTGSLRSFAKTLRMAGWIVFGLLLLAAGLALIPPSLALPEPYNHLPTLPDRWLFAAGWLASLVAFGWVALRHRPALPWLASAIVAGGLGYLFVVAWPALDGLRTRRAFTAEVRHRTDPDADRLALFHARDAVFELNRTVPDFPTAGELTEAIHTGRVRWVLARRRYLAETVVPARIIAAEAVLPWDGPDQAGDKLVLLEAIPTTGP